MPSSYEYLDTSPIRSFKVFCCGVFLLALHYLYIGPHFVGLVPVIAQSHEILPQNDIFEKSLSAHGLIHKPCSHMSLTIPTMRNLVCDSLPLTSQTKPLPLRRWARWHLALTHRLSSLYVITLVFIRQDDLMQNKCMFFFLPSRRGIFIGTNKRE